MHDPRGGLRAGSGDAVRHGDPGGHLGRLDPATIPGAGPGRGHTGLRWGELAGLRVRRVDLLHRQITVAEQLLEVRGRLARRVWIPATRAAGVEGLRFHDLRHTAATLAVAAGASTRELMVRMGHSSSAAALRYQHVMAGRDAAIAAALDELVAAARAQTEDAAAARTGTRVARTGQRSRRGKRQ
jgi:integrase